MGTLSPAGSRPDARRTRRKVKLWIRRAHLYLGLVLVPWVFLYGLTALLFNHGSWWSERDYVTVGPVAYGNTFDAATLAAAAVAALDADDVTLVPGSEQWVGSVSFRGTQDGHRLFVSLHPDGRGGRLVVSPSSPEAPDWTESWSSWAPLDEAVVATLTEDTLRAVRQVHPDTQDLTLRGFPTLRFDIARGESLNTVELDLAGDREVTSAFDTAPWRSRLLRLHVSHGDPGYVGVRWWWARIVDVMGCAMMTWGVTGLLMWWTIRPTRTLGGLALAAGVGTMAALAISIWSVAGML